MLSRGQSTQFSAQKETITPRAEVISEIHELFEIPPFGRSVPACKRTHLDKLQPTTWNSAEVDFFAESFAKLYCLTQNPNLFELRKTTIGQAGLLATIITDYVFRTDSPRLKISLSTHLLNTGIASAHQIGWALWHCKNYPFDDTAGKNTSHFEWAGRAMADDIISASPANAVALVNEFSNSTIALYNIENHWGFEENFAKPSVLKQFLNGYFCRLDEKLDITDSGNQNLLVASYILLLSYQEKGVHVDNIASFFSSPLQVVNALLNFTYCTFIQGDLEDAQDGMIYLNSIVWKDLLRNSPEAQNSFLFDKNLDSIKNRYPRTIETTDLHDFIDRTLSLKRCIMYINQSGIQRFNIENDDGA